MTISVSIVNAFTNKPFSGNPAGVCILTASAEVEWMQRVATELNQPTTAFLYPQDDGYNLRWFTPTTELELCGHATLCSVHILAQQGHLATGQMVRFYTQSGLLTATLQGEWVELDFPSISSSPVTVPPELITALGVTPVNTARNKFDYLVEVGSEAEVRNAAPDLEALRKIEMRGVIITSRASTPGYDIVSRFFAPAIGINEDQVTGSAHCCLTPYWLAKLEGKTNLHAYQASGRGGSLKLRMSGDRVLMSGQVTTILKGEFTF